MTGYYLQDTPNATTQYGWARTKVSGVVGVHTAENQTDFEGADPGAEDVAGFLTRRTDYGSYHVLADADTIVPLVHPSYAAWADTTNNAHAMSVSGAMQAARWRELSPARAAAITKNMAYGAAQLVRTAVAAGLLSAPTPARRITPAEAIAGSRAGFYGHGETNPGRRYDPGENFDWDLFLSTYAAAVGGGTNYQGTTTEDEDNMANLFATREEFQTAVTEAVFLKARFDTKDETNKVTGTITLKDLLTYYPANIALDRRQLRDGLAEIGKSVAESVKAGDAVNPDDVADQIAEKLEGMTFAVARTESGE